MKPLLCAFSTLTLLPISPRIQYEEKNLAASIIYYPLVGFVLGTMLLIPGYLLQSRLTPLPLAALLLFFGVILTGGLHLDGLADLADGLGAGGPPERILAAMKDSHVGAFGVIALVLVLLLKASLFFDIIDKGRWQIFLLAGLLSRWAMAFAAFLGKYPRETGTGRAFIGKIRRGQIIVATAFALLCSTLILRGTGLAAMVLAALTTGFFVFYLRKRIGGITGDGLGALNEKVEVLVMLFVMISDGWVSP